MNKVLKFIKSYFLQFVLAIVAMLSFAEVEDIGYRYTSEVGTYETVEYNKLTSGSFGHEREYYSSNPKTAGTSVALSTGYSASAISMGLICSVCIVMIVWIEIRKPYNLNS